MVTVNAVRGIFSFLVKNATNQLQSRRPSTVGRVMDLSPTILDKLNSVVSATALHPSLQFHQVPLTYLFMLSTAKAAVAMLIQGDIQEKMF